MKQKLSRCVTIYGQWNYVSLWVDNDELYDPSVEWMIINDLPSDPCPEVLKDKLQVRGVELLTPQFNLGRSSARNFCARRASGKWVEFVDGDDIPLPLSPDEWTGNDDKLLHQFPSKTYELRNGNVESCELERDSEFGYPGVLSRLSGVNCRPACLVYDRATFLEAGGFDGRYDTIEDLHLLWKLEKYGVDVYHHDKPKQLYQRDGKESPINYNYSALYKVRFFREAALRSKQARCSEVSAMWDYSDSYMTHVAEMCLGELKSHADRNDYVHPEYLHPHLKFKKKYSITLFWLARDIFVKSWKPGIICRMREALRLVFAR